MCFELGEPPVQGCKCITSHIYGWLQKLDLNIVEFHIWFQLYVPVLFKFQSRDVLEWEVWVLVSECDGALLW